MEVLSPQSTLQDAVAFARIGVPMPSNYPNVLQAVQSVGQRLPANCGGAPCTDTSTPNAGQISVDWASAGTTQTAARTSGSPDTNQKSDWTVAASTMGADN
jgi:hypothetical protein